jgi:hypothetical protein
VNYLYVFKKIGFSISLLSGLWLPTQALAVYSSIVDKYPDFAITDYARLDRALLLFQNGNRSRVRAWHLDCSQALPTKC